MINFDFSKRFQPRPKNRVGLDIGSSSVKIVEISFTSEMPSLLCIGSKAASSAVHEPLIEAIKSLAEEIKIKGKDAAISVSGPSVTVRFVSMPKMRDDELKGAIHFEAEKYTSVPINDCIVDYQVLKKTDAEGKMGVLLVAVKKSVVLDRIKIAEDSGFSVGAVDVDSFAVANAYMKNFTVNSSEKTVALLNIGSAFSNLSIVRGGLLCFARDISINSLESKGALTSLLEEIRLSFNYYENQSGAGINEICISGGNANFPGLGQAFKDAFDVSPDLWDPLQFVDKSSVTLPTDIIEKTKGSFAVAAGLALR